MPNGKRGDSRLNDMLVHGLHPFPPDIEAMLREVLRPRARDSPMESRPYPEGCEWLHRFNAWRRGKGWTKAARHFDACWMNCASVIRKGLTSLRTGFRVASPVFPRSSPRSLRESRAEPPSTKEIVSFVR